MWAVQAPGFWKQPLFTVRRSRGGQPYLRKVQAKFWALRAVQIQGRRSAVFRCTNEGCGSATKARGMERRTAPRARTSLFWRPARCRLIRWGGPGGQVGGAAPSAVHSSQVCSTIAPAFWLEAVSRLRGTTTPTRPRDRGRGHGEWAWPETAGRAVIQRGSWCSASLLPRRAS